MPQYAAPTSSWSSTARFLIAAFTVATLAVKKGIGMVVILDLCLPPAPLSSARPGILIVPVAQ